MRFPVGKIVIALLVIMAIIAGAGLYIGNQASPSPPITTVPPSKTVLPEQEETQPPLEEGQPLPEEEEPASTQGEEEYGEKPEKADFESWDPESYPYLATLPAGTERKVRVAYNFIVERPSGGRYSVDIKITNLSDRPLKMLYYDEFLKDGEGNILHEKRNESHHNAPPQFPLQPGESTILQTSKVHMSGSFGPPPVESWTVEVEVTYIKFF